MGNLLHVVESSYGTFLRMSVYLHTALKGRIQWSHGMVLIRVFTVALKGGSSVYGTYVSHVTSTEWSGNHGTSVLIRVLHVYLNTALLGG